MVLWHLNVLWLKKSKDLRLKWFHQIWYIAGNGGLHQECNLFLIITFILSKQLWQEADETIIVSDNTMSDQRVISLNSILQALPDGAPFFDFLVFTYNICTTVVVSASIYIYFFSGKSRIFFSNYWKHFWSILFD